MTNRFFLLYYKTIDIHPEEFWLHILFKFRFFYNKLLPQTYEFYRGKKSTIVAIDYGKLIDTIDKDYFCFNGQRPEMCCPHNRASFLKELQKIGNLQNYIFNTKLKDKIPSNEKEDDQCEEDIKKNDEEICDDDNQLCDQYKLILQTINHELTEKRKVQINPEVTVQPKKRKIK